MRSMMKKREREKKRSRAHITPHDASPGKPRLIIIITIALFHLFSLAKKKNNNTARYYKTTKQNRTSKLFALNPFDAGVANVINDDCVFSPET